MAADRKAYMREYMRKKRAEARAAAADGAPAEAPAKPAATPRKRPVSRARASEATNAKPAAAPRARQGEHRKAVTRLLRATGLNHIAEEAPLVAYLKQLADELDVEFDPKTRVQYLAALKDVRKVLAYSARPKSSSDDATAAASEPVSGTEEAATDAGDGARVNSLAKFRQARGIG